MIECLVDLAGLDREEVLLVLGASGGIGLSAIAIGVARGARVIACASFTLLCGVHRTVTVDAAGISVP